MVKGPNVSSLFLNGFKNVYLYLCIIEGEKGGGHNVNIWLISVKRIQEFLVLFLQLFSTFEIIPK